MKKDLEGKPPVLFTTCDLQRSVVPVAYECMHVLSPRLATHAKLTGQGRPLHYMQHVCPWRLVSLYDFPQTLCKCRSLDCPLTVQSPRVIDSGVALQSREEGERLTSLPFWADRAETGSRHPACVAVSYTPANLIQHGTFLWSIFPINFQWHIITTCNHLQHRHSSLCVQKTSAEKTNTLEDSVIFTKKGNKSTNVVLDMSCATTVQVYSTKADLQMTSCKRIATSI